MTKIEQKQDELIEKKSSCIYHLIKIILRNADKLTLRTWESNFIKDYANTYSTLESELSSLKAEAEKECKECDNTGLVIKKNSDGISDSSCNSTNVSFDKCPKCSKAEKEVSDADIEKYEKFFDFIGVMRKTFSLTEKQLVISSWVEKIKSNK